VAKANFHILAQSTTKGLSSIGVSIGSGAGVVFCKGSVIVK
jgi:hypothetical protein